MQSSCFCMTLWNEVWLRDCCSPPGSAALVVLRLLDANCSSISRANHAAVLPAAIALAVWEVADHRFTHPTTTSSSPSTPLPLVTVCGHAAPSGQTALENGALSFCWLFYRNCFSRCVCGFWQSIINPSKGHSWGFVPSPVISCKTYQPDDGKHYLSLQRIKTKVSLCVRVTVTGCSTVAYIG